MFRILSVPIALFACGLRQDAGFYLVFLLIASASVIPVPAKVMLERVWLPLAIAIAATVMAASGGTPYLSPDAAGLRFWKHMGETPTDLIVYVLTHPGQIQATLKDSAFLDLNKSFGWLPLVHPAGWLANLSALPMYLARPDEYMAKRLLLLYNSAMILPAMLVAVFGAIRGGLILTLALPRMSPSRLNGLQTLFTAAVCLLLIRPTVQDRPWLSAFRAQGDLFQPTFDAISRIRKICKVDSISGDYYGITLVPNSLRRFVLPNVSNADLVLITDRLRYSPDHLDRAETLKSLRDYRVYSETDRLVILIKQGIICESGGH